MSSTKRKRNKFSFKAKHVNQARNDLRKVWFIQGRNEGGQGEQNSPGAESLWGAPKSANNVTYFLQYSTFASERAQVRTCGRQTSFFPRAPSNLVTLLGLSLLNLLTYCIVVFYWENCTMHTFCSFYAVSFLGSVGNSTQFLCKSKKALWYHCKVLWYHCIHESVEIQSIVWQLTAF